VYGSARSPHGNSSAKVGVMRLAKPQEIKFSELDPEKRPEKEDVKIIWKGNRIARLIFKSGKVVEFQS